MASSFDFLLNVSTYIFILLIPLAIFLLLDLQTATPNHMPPADMVAPHSVGGALPSQSPSSSSSSSPKLEPRHPPKRRKSLPSQAPAASQASTPPSRRAHAINTHIDRLMAQRATLPIFDDNSDFDFRPGNEDEYLSEEEEVHCPSPSPFPNTLQDSHNDDPGSESESEFNYCRIPHHFLISHNNAVMAPILAQLDQAASAKTSARTAAIAAAQTAGAAKTKARMEQSQALPSPETIRRITTSNADPKRAIPEPMSSPSPSACAASHDHPSPPPSYSSSGSSYYSTPPPSPSPHRRAILDSHIDALMRQQTIQNPGWAQFESSAGPLGLQAEADEVNPEKRSAEMYFLHQEQKQASGGDSAGNTNVNSPSDPTAAMATATAAPSPSAGVSWRRERCAQIASRVCRNQSQMKDPETSEPDWSDDEYRQGYVAGEGERGIGK